MKVGVIGAIAFVVGLAGSTVVSMRAHPAGKAAGDSSHVATADSGKASHDTSATKESAPAHDTTTAKPEAGEHAAAPAADSGKAVAPKTEPVPLPAPNPAPSAAAPKADDVKHLAGILGKLSATDAAPLLERFSDAEVGAVLRAMDVTRAAALLGALPKARAATLSRQLLFEKKP